MRRRRLVAAVSVATVVAVTSAACSSSGNGTPAPSASLTGPLSTPPIPVTSLTPTSGAAPDLAIAREVRRFGYLTPDPKYTPGAALDVGTAQICTTTWADAHKSISFTVQNEVADRYAVISGPGTTVRLDLLIPATLGGTTTAANVWPQDLRDKPNGITAKNSLEAHLRALVCRSQVPLATAQHDIAADWPAAARKYLAIAVASPPPKPPKPPKPSHVKPSRTPKPSKTPKPHPSSSSPAPTHSTTAPTVPSTSPSTSTPSPGN